MSAKDRSILEILSVLEDKATEGNDRLECYTSITRSFKEDGERTFGASVVAKISRLVSVIRSDVSSAPSNVVQSALEVLGVCLHDQEIVTSVSEDEGREILQSLCECMEETDDKNTCTRALWSVSEDEGREILQSLCECMEKTEDKNTCTRALWSVSEDEGREILQSLCECMEETEDKNTCTRALWCIGKQNLTDTLIQKQVEAIVTAMELAIEKWKGQSVTVEHESVNTIARLTEQAPGEMSKDSARWGKLLLPLVSHAAVKVRDHVLAVVETTMPLMETSRKDLVANIVPVFKTKVIPDLKKLFSSKHELYVLKCWGVLVQLFADELHRGNFINYLLPVVEMGFKSVSPEIKIESFRAWQQLIDNFAQNPNILGDPKRIKLIMAVFKINNARAETVAMVKLKVWWHFVWMLGSKLSNNFDMVAAPLLQFCVGGSKSAENQQPGTPRSTLKVGASPATPRMNLTMPGGSGNQWAVFKSLQSSGCEALALMLGLPDLAEFDHHFKLDPLRFEVVTGPSFFIKQSALFISTASELFTSLGQEVPEVLVLHIWQWLIAHVKNAIDSPLKLDIRETLNTLLTHFQVIVLSRCLESSLLLRMFDGLCQLPRKVLCSTAYSIKGEKTVNGTPALFLMELLLTPTLLQACCTLEPYHNLYTTIVSCGLGNATCTLGFLQSVFEMLGRHADFVHNKESMWRLWSATVTPLLENITSTSEVNQGDALEPNFDSTVQALTLPAVAKLYAMPAPSVKTLLKTWTELYRTVDRLAAMVTNAEANVVCESVCHKLLEQAKGEETMDASMVEMYAQFCLVMAGALDYSSLDTQSAFHLGYSPAKKVAKKRQRSLENIHSMVHLLAKLQEQAISLASTGDITKKPAGAPLQGLFNTLVEVLCTLFSHVSSSHIIAHMVHVLAEPLGSLYGEASRRASIKVYNNAFQQKLEKLWLDICTCLTSRYTALYDSEFLRKLSPLLAATFLHSRRQIKNQTLSLWSSTFSKSAALEYPDILRPVLTKVKEKNSVTLPGWVAMASPVIDETPVSQMSQSQAPEPRLPGMPSPHKIHGSFLNKAPVSPINTRKSPMRSPVSPRPVAVTRGNSAKKKVLGWDGDDKDFVVIKSSPRKKMVLTDHQREVLKERRVFPAMYNTLEISQDVSMMASHLGTDTQQSSETNTPTPTMTQPFSLFGSVVPATAEQQQSDSQRSTQPDNDQEPKRKASPESEKQKPVFSSPEDVDGKKSKCRRSVRFKEKLESKEKIESSQDGMTANKTVANNMDSQSDVVIIDDSQKNGADLDNDKKEGAGLDSGKKKGALNDSKKKGSQDNNKRKGAADDSKINGALDNSKNSDTLNDNVNTDVDTAVATVETVDLTKDSQELSSKESSGKDSSSSSAPTSIPQNLLGVVGLSSPLSSSSKSSSESKSGKTSEESDSQASETGKTDTINNVNNASKGEIDTSVASKGDKDMSVGSKDEKDTVGSKSDGIFSVFGTNDASDDDEETAVTSSEPLLSWTQKLNELSQSPGLKSPIRKSLSQDTKSPKRTGSPHRSPRRTKKKLTNENEGFTALDKWVLRSPVKTLDISMKISQEVVVASMTTSLGGTFVEETQSPTKFKEAGKSAVDKMASIMETPPKNVLDDLSVSHGNSSRKLFNSQNNFGETDIMMEDSNIVPASPDSKSFAAKTGTPVLKVKRLTDEEIRRYSPSRGGDEAETGLSTNWQEKDAVKCNLNLDNKTTEASHEHDDFSAFKPLTTENVSQIEASSKSITESEQVMVNMLDKVEGKDKQVTQSLFSQDSQPDTQSEKTDPKEPVSESVSDLESASQDSQEESVTKETAEVKVTRKTRGRKQETPKKKTPEEKKGRKKKGDVVATKVSRRIKEKRDKAEAESQSQDEQEDKQDDKVKQVAETQDLFEASPPSKKPYEGVSREIVAKAEDEKAGVDAEEDMEVDSTPAGTALDGTELMKVEMETVKDDKTVKASLSSSKSSSASMKDDSKGDETETVEKIGKMNEVGNVETEAVRKESEPETNEKDKAKKKSEPETNSKENVKKKSEVKASGKEQVNTEKETETKERATRQGQVKNKSEAQKNKTQNSSDKEQEKSESKLDNGFSVASQNTPETKISPKQPERRSTTKRKKAVAQKMVLKRTKDTVVNDSDSNLDLEISDEDIPKIDVKKIVGENLEKKLDNSKTSVAENGGTSKKSEEITDVESDMQENKEQNGKISESEDNDTIKQDLNESVSESVSDDDVPLVAIKEKLVRKGRKKKKLLKRPENGSPVSTKLRSNNVKVTRLRSVEKKVKTSPQSQKSVKLAVKRARSVEAKKKLINGDDVSDSKKAKLDDIETKQTTELELVNGVKTADEVIKASVTNVNSETKEAEMMELTGVKQTVESLTGDSKNVKETDKLDLDKSNGANLDETPKKGTEAPVKSSLALFDVNSDSKLILGSRKFERKTSFARRSILKSAGQASPGGVGSPKRRDFHPITVARIYSPTASPSASILKKRRLTEDSGSDTNSPPAKQRRVSFAEPIEAEGLTQESLPTSPLVKDHTEKPLPGTPTTSQSGLVGNQTQSQTQGSTQGESQTQGSYASTQGSQLDTTEPVYPGLKSCDQVVDKVLPQLTSSIWSRGLGQLMRARNIQTIGDLSSLTEGDIQSLPIRSPKVQTVRRVLDKFDQTQRARAVKLWGTPKTESPLLSKQKDGDAEMRDSPKPVQENETSTGTKAVEIPDKAVSESDIDAILASSGDLIDEVNKLSQTIGQSQSQNMTCDTPASQSESDSQSLAGSGLPSSQQGSQTTGSQFMETLRGLNGNEAAILKGLRVDELFQVHQHLSSLQSQVVSSLRSRCHSPTSNKH